jgi:tRNA threonylcarbamoyladenosine biosynthesis protein TsaE
MEDSRPTVNELSCSALNELPQIAKKIFSFAKSIKVWLFVGDLGAGKTTLIKELCKFMGVVDEVASPTFAIINEYLANQKPVYHFDFYRIKNVEEAINIGVSEYFDSGNYCFIEWPQKVEVILPDRLVLIEIEGSESENRVFKLTKYE